MKFVWRMLLGIGLGILSAALLTLAFPPYNLWPLVFVGLVPVVVAQHRVMPPRFSGLAYGVGIGGFFAGYFGGMFAGGPWFMRWLPLFIGIIAALVSSRDRAFHQRTHYRWFVLHGAVVWVGIEMIRGFIPMIGTWGFAANALYAQPWLIQPVSIFGIYGLSLLILGANYTLALGALAIFDRLDGPNGTWRLDPEPAHTPANLTHAKDWLLGSLVALVAWIGGSVVLLQLPMPSASARDTVRVAAIHPARRVRRDAQGPDVEALAYLYAQTRQAAEQGAEFIVWNEAALPFDPQVNHTQELRALTAETDAYLVIGYVVEEEQGVRNEATLLTPKGEFLGVYGKDHPVVWGGETSLSRGEYPVYETSLGPRGYQASVGIIICYDLDFTDTARKIVRQGAQLVAVPSYDWRAIAHKHYSHVVFRAVENRVSMVKADIGWGSAIVDPHGRILERVVTLNPEPAILVADVPLGTANTLALRLGDWIGWLCIAGMVFFVGVDLITARDVSGSKARGGSM